MAASSTPAPSGVVREARVALPSGASIWYEVRGDARDPAVLLIMGHGSQAIEWPESLRAGLAAAGRYVIAYDNRDAGLSEDFTARWAAGERYSMADLAADGLALLDHLGVSRAHLVGFSLGGVLAQHLAADAPDRVASLLLMASSPAWEWAAGGVPADARYLSVLTPAPEDDRESCRAYIRRVRLAMAGHAFPYDPTDQEPLIERILERGYSPGRIRRQFRAARSGQRLAGAVQGVPVWLLHGDDDPVVPVPHIEALMAGYPDARFDCIPGLGHQPHPAVLERFLPEIVVFSAAREPTRRHGRHGMPPEGVD